MAKVVFVTYLIALTICLISAYQQECAIGPEYWCKSFQNAQDCGALHHCTDTVWRYDEKHTQIDSSTKCEWCQKILENTHKAIQNVANNEDLIKTTLINGCKLLPLEDISSKCTNVIENYETIVLSLMKQQRYDTLCHLMDICPNEISKFNENIEKTNIDEQSKMLCNVIVRATQELHVKQQKSKNEIEIFLKNDCQQLKTSQLVEKCEDLVEQYGNEIYAHVASNIELSKICDYINSSALQSIPKVHCELCTFVLSIAKQMLDAKHTEDKVLIYIDEQICSRLNGKLKKNCKEMLDTNGRDLINNIQNGIQPMLLCTHFQVCLDKIIDTTSPIGKEEMHSFLKNNFCEKLGLFKSACQASIEKDGTDLLQILTNEISGKELCHMFGLCPKKSPLLEEFVLKDDPSKCERCVKDFTRRKHIAERLVNHSSEFLHHLCGQLPQQDDCIKAVDDSIDELVTFIRSLDPRDICIQLNMCDQKVLEMNVIIPSDNIINEEIVEYVKTDVCNKLGSLSELCTQLADSEGLNLLNLIYKNIDPHQICTIIDVCPSNIVFQNCHDKCQCCTNKIKIYERKLEQFMRTIVASTRIMCDHVPGRDKCLQLADIFESNVNKVVARFDSKYTCQLLSLCTSSEKKSNEDQCESCKTELDTRQNRFYTTVNQLTTTLLSLCQDNNCRLNVQSLQKETLEKINNINSPKLCQRLGYCISENSFEPSAILLRLKSLVQHQTKTLEERLEAHNICSEYGQLKSICEHLLISTQSHRYTHVYTTLLKNNPKLIDDDLREQMQTKIDTNTCDLCKNAVQSSKDFWENALESVRNILLQTCNYCSVKDKCLDYYNQQFDNIKSYLNNIDPTQFCQTLHLCSTSICANMGVFQKSCEEALLTFKHDPQTFEQHLPHTSVVVLPTKSEESNELTIDSNSTCILCEYAMNILANYIHQQSTEEEIKQSLEKVCNQMPTTLQKQCHELIDNYGPPIIAILIQDFDVSTICRKLNLCTQQMKVELSHVTKANLVSCGVCDYISTYIHFALKRDSSEKSLQHALSTVCKHLSNEQTSKCQTIVQLFATTNLRQVQLGPGNNFCQQLTICQTPWSELKPAIHLSQILSKQESIIHKDEELKQIIIKNLDSTPQCTLCHYVVSYLDAVLKNNKSEAAVEDALSRVCTILPRKDRVQCAQFVKTYGPVLAELISELADPALVCRYLGMCQVVSPQDIQTKESTSVTHSNHHHARIPV